MLCGVTASYIFTGACLVNSCPAWVLSRINSRARDRESSLDGGAPAVYRLRPVSGGQHSSVGGSPCIRQTFANVAVEPRECKSYDAVARWPSTATSNER